MKVCLKFKKYDQQIESLIKRLKFGPTNQKISQKINR